MRQVIVCLHKAQRYKPIEPGVGKFLDDVLVTLLPYQLHDVLTPTEKIRRIGIRIAIDDRNVTCATGGFNIGSAVDAQGLQGNLDLLFQVLLGPDSKCLKQSLIHAAPLNTDSVHRRL